MQYEIFMIPAKGDAIATEALNRFLRARRVISVHREFVADGANSFWSLAVEYLPANKGTGSGDEKKQPRVDYKEVLPPEAFAVFSKLREVRKNVAAEAGIPVYAVFTNEQLAKMATNPVNTLDDLARIDGIGEAKLEKFGHYFLGALKPAGQNETGR